MNIHDDEEIEALIKRVKATPGYSEQPSPVMAVDIVRYYEAKFIDRVQEKAWDTLQAVTKADPIGTGTTIRGMVYTWPDLPHEKLRGNGRPTREEKTRLTARYRKSGHENGLIIRQELERLGITPPIDYGRLTWVFYRTAHQAADVNNFVSGMKAFQDGLIDAQVFVDDSSDHMIEGAHDLRTGTENRTEILIEELKR